MFVFLNPLKVLLSRPILRWSNVFKWFCMLYESSIYAVTLMALQAVFVTLRLNIYLDSQLMSGINRRLVHHAVVLQPEILQLAVVSKCPPLRVHAHTAFLSFNQLHGPHLLHVARITASAWPKWKYFSVAFHLIFFQSLESRLH